MGDDYTYDLFWHALNYRTAGPKEAEAMWQELRACSERIVDYALESALAKSESQEAELLEKLKVAEGALGGLRRVVPYFWNDDSSHISELEEACEKADTALAKIKEAS